jgi:hypothetical protein
MMHNRFWHRGNVVMTAIYTLVSLGVVLPMLRPGFILTLDMVFTPHIAMPQSVNNGYLFYAALHVLNTLLPSEILQKILLFSIFLLAGTGMHRLVRTLAQSTETGKAKTFGYYIAGIFYAINPFTYDRLMAGQYGVLLGYALLPYFTQALLLLLRAPTVRRGIAVALWASLLCIVSIHSLGYMVVLGLIGLTLSLIRKRSDKTYARSLLKPMVVTLVVFIIASSYWLGPLMLGKGSTAHQIAQFSSQDTIAFATVGQNAIEKVGNVIRLQGFWQEERYLYELPQNIVRGWGLIGLLVWITVIAGFVHAYRRRQRYIVALFGSGIAAGIILACGALQPFAVHASFLSGFREPQKFAALIALGYSIGIGFGVPAIIRAVQHKARPLGHVTGLLLLCMPFAFTPLLLWGAKGQLTPRHYPDEWYTVNQLLSKDTGHFQSVFLPWHLYMYYDFAGRIIASPAPGFFDKPMLVSDNPEYNGAGAANTSPAKQATGRLLQQATTNPYLAQDLAKQDIKYVLLTPQDDYYNYGYLNHTVGLEKIYDSKTITVYRNTAFQEARP